MNCELCDFTSIWPKGLEIHMSRKHQRVPQLDGGNCVDDKDGVVDECYQGSEHYWKTKYLGQSYQSYLDANNVVNDSSLCEEEKKIELLGILEARKAAIGENYKYFPPWD